MTAPTRTSTAMDALGHLRNLLDRRDLYPDFLVVIETGGIQITWGDLRLIADACDSSPQVETETLRSALHDIRRAVALIEDRRDTTGTERVVDGIARRVLAGGAG